MFDCRRMFNILNSKGITESGENKKVLLLMESVCLHTTQLISGWNKNHIFNMYWSGLASFSPEKRSVLSPTSFLRSVSLQTLNGGVCPYYNRFYILCSSPFGAEDAKDFVLMILRGADWISTLHFKVIFSSFWRWRESCFDAYETLSEFAVILSERFLYISIVYDLLYFDVEFG